MGENTKIEWAHHTFNPVVGCTKVSAACDHCYAESWAKRTGQAGLWSGERRRTSASNWLQPLKWNRAAAVAGERHRVFCASLADVFDNQWNPEWRHDLFGLIAQTQNLDWLLLTKRPQNIAKMLPDNWGAGYANVMLGTTVENQEEADRRIRPLVGVLGRHFLSCEPLLGPLDISAWLGEPCVEWVIAGGESGHGARPASIQWFREIRDQCAEAEVPFLYKQWGEWAPAGMQPSGTPGRFAFGDYEHDRTRFIQTDFYPRQFDKFGSRCILERVGKARAGRLLDGIEHNGFPK